MSHPLLFYLPYRQREEGQRVFTHHECPLLLRTQNGRGDLVEGELGVGNPHHPPLSLSVFITAAPTKTQSIGAGRRTGGRASELIN